MANYNHNFTLTEEQREYFTAVLMLEQLCNQNQQYSVLLDGNLKSLETVFEKLLLKEYVEISGINYVAAPKGRNLLQNFLEKYSEFIKLYDIFCAVDLGAGEFGFQEFFNPEFEDRERWEMYLKSEQFEDLRCAVSTFKGINPIEVIFMSFINEGRFKLTNQIDWAFDLKAGFIWDDIVTIYNSQLRVEDLGFETENGEYVAGDVVIQDVIIQGTNLLMDLLNQEEEMKTSRRSSPQNGQRTQLHSSNFGHQPQHHHTTSYETTYYVETPYYGHDHYDHYYHDPHYRSNSWDNDWYDDGYNYHNSGHHGGYYYD